MIRTANAVWKGTGLEGSGTLTTRSGALSELPYSTKTRFENEDGRQGTNPEELLAAAHAGCFNMALSFQLVGAGFTPEELATEAKVDMSREGVHYKVAKITLKLTGKVPGISKEQFLELATNAKNGCPISQALAGSVDIVLEATLD
ncbi:OsmC family protein [Cesiribacter andamanensis]|uniref:Peroxiredoxin osmC n=1 Tax=Cesiribacter andamanensis AMV16 TaxID=1279009 RepID=M7N0Y0_9BACT|nr:OsmC family protein [Cesiribacter andamanensis]EMR02323.1 Peroxiredoxin osmC [Cesiribacter andamanensis AMV16]